MLVKIRFTKDAEEVKAKADGGRRTVKIPRGTVMDVKPRSAAYWCESMNVAERVRGAATSSIKAPALPGLPSLPEPSSVLEDFMSIRDGIGKQDFDSIYPIFGRFDDEVTADLTDKGLTSDSAMILDETIKEIHEKGAIETISLTEITDAVNEAIQVLSTPAKTEKAPALPTPARPRGRPAGAVSKSK